LLQLQQGLLYLLIAITSGCSTVPTHTTDKTASSAFNQPETTYLGKTAADIAADHNGESGFLLLDRGRDALSWRAILADAAQKSIDAQYFPLERGLGRQGHDAAIVVCCRSRRTCSCDD